MSRFSQVTLTLWALLCVFGCLSCSRDESSVVVPRDVTDRHVIVIVIDSLRADHLGSYGYHRATSPFMDRLAAEGLAFDQAFSSSSFTQQSIATLMSGHFPSRTGSTEWGVPPVESPDTLGSVYQRAGYRTGFFSNTPVLKDRLFSQGFDEAEILTDRWDLSGGGSKLVERALEFAAQESNERFLLYLHFLDPHAPYSPGPDHYRLFSKRRLHRPPLRLYPQVRDECHELIADGFGPGDPRFEDLVLRYDAEIRVVDDALRQLFEGLEHAGRLDDTMVVITSDHGEEFLDHEFVEHAWTLYDESLRVPLIFWTPGLQGRRTDVQVGLADLLPTLLELSGIPYDAERLDGRSILLPTAGGFELRTERRAHLAEVLIQRRNVLRSLRIGRWKYIASWRWLSPEERPAALALAADQIPKTDIWGPPNGEELYDLEADPKESHNVLDQHPELASRFRRHMETYLASCSQDDGRAATPLSAEEENALKSLGYL